MKIHYNPKLKERASKLRNNSTYSEHVLWKYLKGRKLFGYQFMRQKPIDNYIADFYCSPLKLVIEVDGLSHLDKFEYDLRRDKKLKALGLEVMHFDGYSVIRNTDNVVHAIEQKIKEIEKLQNK